MDDPLSGYCDYLDKEMTIMGLLSAFAVGVPAVVFDSTAGADKETALASMWGTDRTLIVAGGVAFLLAALFFYLQRSLLAYYIGQLRFSQTVARYDGMTAKEVLEEADSWATWIHYQTAFVLLTLGFSLYGVVFWPAAPRPWTDQRIVVVLSLVAVSTVIINAAVKTVYRYHDRPWADAKRLKKPITS